MSDKGFKWLDQPGKYGVVSKLFHWSMALIFALLFLGLWLELSFGLHAKDLPLTPSHVDFGAALFVFSIARALWALTNFKNRFSGHRKNQILAKVAHVGLYLLMLVIPILGVLFFYSYGRPVRLLGVFQLFQDVVPSKGLQVLLSITEVFFGQSLHGLLGWAFLILIALHLVMVLIHQFYLRDGVFGKMWRL